MPERYCPKDLAIPTTPDAQEIFIKNPKDIEKARKAVLDDIRKIRSPKKKPRK